MWSREDLGVRLFLAGLGLGIVLMGFVVTFDGFGFYVSSIAPTVYEVMRPLGYVLDAGILLSFAMTVGGIACFPSHPPSATAPAPAKPLHERRRKSGIDHRGQPKPAAHGST